MNQKSVIAILGVVVVILIGTTVYFATINKASQSVASAPTIVQQPVSTPTPVVQQFPQPDVNKQSANAVATCEIGNKVYFEIKELGVKFLVDKSIKDDLIYKYSGQDKYSMGAVMISAKSLISMDAGCSADNGPLGSLSKLKGKPNDSIYDTYYQNRADQVKQFNGFFLTASGPQAPCALNEKDVQKVNDYANQLRDKIYLEDAKCFDVLK